MMTGTSGRAALIFGRSSRPVMPGMLMSEKTRMRLAPSGMAMRSSASPAELANFIKNRPARSSRLNCCWNRAATSGSSSTTRMRTLTAGLLSLPRVLVQRPRRRILDEIRKLGPRGARAHGGPPTLILVFSDINMPGMTGLELLPRIKAARPDVPVIMITAYGDAETRRKALEAGAAGLLTKPIDFTVLRQEVDQRLAEFGSAA